MLLRHRVPDMRRQKGEFEKENLKLHLCNAVFEAYSASYLTMKHHMLSGDQSNNRYCLQDSWLTIEWIWMISSSCSSLLWFFLSVASESYNLSWVINCEMASFIRMKESNRFYSHPESEGLVIQVSLFIIFDDLFKLRFSLDWWK